MVMIIFVLGWFMAGFLGGWLFAKVLSGKPSIKWPSAIIVDDLPKDNVQFVEASIAKEQLEQATSLKDLI